MSIQNFPYGWSPSSQLVKKETGAPTRDGIDLLNALFNRTGGANGIVNQTAHINGTADAQPLTANWNYIGTTPAGSGRTIPALQPGQSAQVYNAGANNLNVYPSAGFQIDALGVGNPYVLAPGARRNFECWQANVLISS